MVENITWKEIIESDVDKLQQYCDDFDLPERGDEDNLRERLLRHILSISLPSGEIFLQGKININKATAEEMSLWPFMGHTLIRNILDYRKKYEKFHKIEDLLNVKGVGDNLFKKLVPFVDVTGKTHIRVIKGIRVEADLEFIKLEDEIRQKAWEIQDVHDHLSINMDSLGELMAGVEEKESLISKNLKLVTSLDAKLEKKAKRMMKIKDQLEKKITFTKELEVKKKQEIKELQAERILLEKILPWKFIITSDLEELQNQCEELGLSSRGDEASLRDRLMRHILKINLPVGELLLEGKLNLNTATPEEMSLWPYMGSTLVKNIMSYRDTYGKFYKVEDLLNVKGVGNNLFKKLVQFVDVSGKTHIKVKHGTRAEADMELIKLEDDIRNKAWELQDLKDHVDIDVDYLSELTRELEAERDTIGDNIGELEEFQAKIALKEKELEVLKNGMSEQFESLKAIRENSENAAQEIMDLKEEAEMNKRMSDEALSEIEDQRKLIEGERAQVADEKSALEEERKRLDELKGEIQNADSKLKEINEREENLISRENDIDSKAGDLKDLEQHLNDIRFGVGAKPEDMDVETVDIPILVQRDPGDENPEDDRVILDSTDGYIRRIINVYYQGQKMEDDYSRVVFKDIPVKKSYNIMVDTGERKYFLMKNFNPGGAA